MNEIFYQIAYMNLDRICQQYLDDILTSNETKEALKVASTWANSYDAPVAADDPSFLKDLPF